MPVALFLSINGAADAAAPVPIRLLFHFLQRGFGGGQIELFL